jgi:hypothetical protein
VAKRGPTIADAALELIEARGPMTMDDLTPLLVNAGRTTAKNPKRAIASAITGNRRFLEGLDDRRYSIVHQLEGSMFAARPTNLERLEEVVLVRPDLALLGRLLTHERWALPEDRPHLDFFANYFGLPGWDDDILDVDDDGRPIYDESYTLRQRMSDDTARTMLSFMEELGVPRGAEDDGNLRELLYLTRWYDIIRGPAGWLPEVSLRDLLGLRVEGGSIRAIAIDHRSVAGPHVEAAGRRIARIAQRVIGPDSSWFGPTTVDLELLLIMVATEAPELFRRPMPPLTEVIRKGGLEVEGGLVGYPGTDFDDPFAGVGHDPADVWGFEPPNAVS